MKVLAVRIPESSLIPVQETLIDSFSLPELCFIVIMAAH